MIRLGNVLAVNLAKFSVAKHTGYNLARQPVLTRYATADLESYQEPSSPTGAFPQIICK